MQALSSSFFARPAEVVGPEIIGCRLVKRQTGVSLVWVVVVATGAYPQAEPACNSFHSRLPQKETLFGDAANFAAVIRTAATAICI